MANLELLTLAKALSVKNRLAGRLAQARENIETYNSVLAGQRDNLRQGDSGRTGRVRSLPQASGRLDRRQGDHQAGQLANHQACDEWPLAD